VDQNDFHNNDKMRNYTMLKGIEKTFNYFYLQKKIANICMSCTSLPYWSLFHFAAGFYLAITDRMIANQKILNTKYVSTQWPRQGRKRKKWH